MSLFKKNKIFAFASFNLAFLSILVILLLFFILPQKQLLVDIRFALFSKKVNPDVLNLTLEDLENKYGFKSDPIVDKYSKNITYDSILNLARTIKAPTTENKPYKNLNEKIETINSKGGFCSDFSEVFVAKAVKRKIEVREVHSLIHTFNCVYSNSLRKWTYIDVNFGLIAVDSNGRRLGIVEMQDKFRKEDTVYFYDYFKNKIVFNQFNSTNPYYAIRTSFNIISLTLGNNVFEVDYFSNKMSFLPKEVIQLFQLICGIQPKYLYALADDNVIDKYEDIRINLLLIITILLSFLILINLLIYFRLKST